MLLPGISTQTFLHNLKHNVFISQIISQPNFLSKEYNHSESLRMNILKSHFGSLLTPELLNLLPPPLQWVTPQPILSILAITAQLYWTWNSAITFLPGSLLPDFSRRRWHVWITTGRKAHQGRKGMQLFGSTVTNKGICRELKWMSLHLPSSTQQAAWLAKSRSRLSHASKVLIIIQKPSPGVAATAGRLTHVCSDHGGLVFRDRHRGLVLIHAVRVLIGLMLTLAELWSQFRVLIFLPENKREFRLHWQTHKTHPQRMSLNNKIKTLRTQTDSSPLEAPWTRIPFRITRWALFDAESFHIQTHTPDKTRVSAYQKTPPFKHFLKKVGFFTSSNSKAKKNWGS